MIKLYWQDPYLRTFEATVVARRELAGHPAVALDRTCFYPTSGGQPHDTGLLNKVAVLDVVEDDGDVWHVLAAPLLAECVHGEIDWARRFDHMQQHTGQHILSQAFIQTAKAETVSFHLSADTVTIDIATPALTNEQAAAAEHLANEVVMSAREVTTTEHPPEMIGLLGLRKQPDVTGTLRVVDVAGFDRCACGGTHVRNTGELGQVHVARWEPHQGETRVEFLCGWRAQRDYAARDALLRGLARDLTVGWTDVPDRVAKLVEQQDQASKQMEELRLRLLNAELPQLVARAEQRPGYRLLATVLTCHDAADMRYMAQQLLQGPSMVVLLGVTEPSVQVCFGRSADLDLDMNQLLREAGKPLNVRGGGKPQMAQGGGIAAHDLPMLLQRAAGALAQAE